MFLAPVTPQGRKSRQRAIRRNVATLDTRAMVGNIIACYDVAVRHNARSWYVEANEHARLLAQQADVPVTTATGVIAALSPSTAWERNLSLASQMLATGDARHAYGDAIRKARSIAVGGDPDAILGGRKVRSFYRNLSDPTRIGAVTIDRHAFSIALLGAIDPTDHNARRTRTLTDAELKRLDHLGVYHMVAACYRSAARRLGLAPHDLQSITWDYWRDIHAYGTTANVERF